MKTKKKELVKRQNNKTKRTQRENPTKKNINEKRTEYQIKHDKLHMN